MEYESKLDNDRATASASIGMVQWQLWSTRAGAESALLASARGGLELQTDGSAR